MFPELLHDCFHNSVCLNFEFRLESLRLGGLDDLTNVEGGFMRSICQKLG